MLLPATRVWVFLCVCACMHACVFKREEMSEQERGKERDLARHTYSMQLEQNNFSKTTYVTLSVKMYPHHINTNMQWFLFKSFPEPCMWALFCCCLFVCLFIIFLKVWHQLLMESSSVCKWYNNKGGGGEGLYSAGLAKQYVTLMVVGVASTHSTKSTLKASSWRQIIKLFIPVSILQLSCSCVFSFSLAHTLI